MIEMTRTLSHKVGVKPACAAIGLARSSLYRWEKGPRDRVKKPRPTSKRRITETERDQILSLLNSDRFGDLAPRQVYATLLDEGAYPAVASYKLRVLQQADACAGNGGVGALLRREGLYYSNLCTWRRQRDQGQLAGLRPKKRGRKTDPVARENARLKREVEHLKARLDQAETIIDVQKKLSKLLGVSLPQDGEK